MKLSLLCLTWLTLSSAVYAESELITEPPLEPSTTESVTTPAPAIDCSYHISSDTKTIDKDLVTQWGAQALQQSFALDYKVLEKQLAELKSCYTEQGWRGFNQALEESGNLDAIKTKQLRMNAKLDGNPTLVDARNSLWRLKIPLEVVYQNDQEKLTQTLEVTLVVGRKVSGDLGIMQMIASSKKILKS